MPNGSCVAILFHVLADSSSLPYPRGLWPLDKTHRTRDITVRSPDLVVSPTGIEFDVSGPNTQGKTTLYDRENSVFELKLSKYSTVASIHKNFVLVYTASRYKSVTSNATIFRFDVC